MHLEQFKKGITNPEFTDQDKEVLFAYGQNEVGYENDDEWEMFVGEINTEWEVNPELDPDDDSDVEFVEVSKDRRLVRFA
ncbi:MAG: hypothetical protein HGA33_00680 [Candidatus Moranbacteria bacterium]|nr:hypothetical protein [Candidatus Moranbacteria bacterium]